MTEIRPAHPEDVSQAKALWKRCFGDDDFYIDLFFARYCNPEEQLLVVMEDGQLASMVVALDAEFCFPDGSRVPTGYLYALATNPDLQGHGYARDVLRCVDTQLTRREKRAVSLLPASASLHRFFDRLGYNECFATRKVEFLRDVIEPVNPADLIEPVSAAEYNRIREALLAGTCHLSYSDHLLNLQAEICRFCGGNLYRIVVDGEEGCLAAEYYNVADRRVQCKELLISPGRMARAASLLAEAMPSSRYHLRSPAFWDGLPGSYIQSFAMLKWYDPDLHRQWSRSSDCYIGFAFD